MPWTFDDGVPVSGTGVVLSPMQGARVEVTAIPPSFGSRVGEPPLYWDLGYVVWIAGDQWADPTLLQVPITLLYGAPAGTAGLAYSLLPGVEATISPGYYLPGERLDEGRLAPEAAAAGETGWMRLG